LNGVCEDDWDGNFAYVGVRGNIVIDFVIVNENAYNKTIDFKILERVDSNHLPLQLRREGRRKKRRKNGRKKRKDKGNNSMG